jgi:diguanylate cyclase (GGDEF)-like protein
VETSRALPEREAVRSRNLLIQEMLEMHGRAKLGGFFYPLLASAVLAAGVGARLAPVWLMPGVFLALALLRLVPPASLADPGVGRGTDRNPASARRHVRRLWIIVIATAAIWGAFSAWGMRMLPEPAPVLCLLSSGAFGMALAHSMCMRRLPSALCIALVTAPTLAVVVADAKTGIAAVWAVYMLYMFLVMSRSHREYRERIELEEELRHQRNLFERQSRIDGLTGLANRREFIDVLERRLLQSGSGVRTGLLILDVDHFKSVNDTYGHAAGDVCLAALAERLGEHFARPGELCARLGGEEFAVVFDPAAGDGVQRAEGFRASLADVPLLSEDGQRAVTASLGGAVFDPRLHAGADALYRQADAALYRAKMGGRDRICWASDASGSHATSERDAACASTG